MAKQKKDRKELSAAITQEDNTNPLFAILIAVIATLPLYLNFNSTGFELPALSFVRVIIFLFIGALGAWKFKQDPIFLLIIATILIIPLYFNINSFDQFELPKLTLLRIFTAIMLGLWAANIFRKGAIEYVPSPLDIPMLLWVAMNIICTFTSFSPQLSFRGEYENFAGSLSNINYAVLYFIATQNIRSRKQIHTANIALLITGAVITIYAVCQFFGYDIIKWSDTSVIKGRFFATMGNPNFLGAFLIMVIPVCIAFFFSAVRAKKTVMACILCAFFVLLYVALFGTQSRAPFLGFVFSLLIFAVYAWMKRSGKKTDGNITTLKPAQLFNKKWLIGILIAVAVSGVMTFTIGRDAVHRLSSSVADVGGSLKQSRLHIWVPALKMIEVKPALGFGVDTFKTIFPLYEGANFAQIDGANVSSRTAHDELLNIAATMGLPSLGIYILLIVSFVIMWFRSFKRIEDPDFRLLSLAIFAAFSAYFIQNLFSFGVAAINTVLYLFMAFQAFVYAEYYPRKTTVIPLYNAGASAALSYLMQACMIVLSVFVAYRAYILYDADVDYNRGKMLGSINNRWDLAIEEHIKSVQKCPGEVKYHVYLGLAYERLAMMTQDSKSRLDILQKAAQAYQEGTSLNPGNSYYWGNLGRIYMLMGQLDNPEYYKKAEEYYIIAINKAPVTGLFYNNLLDLYVKTGRMDSVDPLLEKVSLYDKQLGSNACFSIGNLYFGNKDVRRAEYYYMKSVELKPDFQYGLFNLGVAAAAVGDTFTSVSSLEKLMDMNPAFEKKDEALRIISNITRKRR